MTFLKITGITRQLNGNSILGAIDFSQDKFQKIAIAGETGSGKSTLLKIIAGLVQPDSGEIIFEDEKVKGPDDRLVPGQPGIKYLSQNFELPGSLRVEQVLSYSNILADDEAKRIYAICKIDHLLAHRTNELSGGEKQRIALAKVLIASPALLLLDEPYSNLDVVHKNILKSVINDISDELKITCILISHDPVDILSWAEEIIVIKNGTIVQQGRPEILYYQPLNEYVAGLLGVYNLLSPSVGKKFSEIHGVDPGKQKLLIRPERLKIVRQGMSSIEGRIKRRSFCGSCIELEVVLLRHVVKLYTDDTTLQVGEIVHVRIKKKHIYLV